MSHVCHKHTFFATAEWPVRYHEKIRARCAAAAPPISGNEQPSDGRMAIWAPSQISNPASANQATPTTGETASHEYARSDQQSLQRPETPWRSPIQEKMMQRYRCRENSPPHRRTMARVKRVGWEGHTNPGLPMAYDEIGQWHG